MKGATEAFQLLWGWHPLAVYSAWQWQLVFLPIPLHDRLCWCVILQTIDIKELKEMGKALEGNKIFEKLTFCDIATLPREFCRHVLLRSGQHSSLSELKLIFLQRVGIVPMMVGCVTVLMCYYSAGNRHWGTEEDAKGTGGKQDTWKVDTQWCLWYVLYPGSSSHLVWLSWM